MANRWGNNGNRDFIFSSSKITADGDCSHEMKRCLHLGRKAMTKVDSVLKSRDITLLTKVHLVKAMVFPVVLYGWESWNIKKIEHWRIDAFELWCWRRLLRVPCTARRSSQSILKKISPDYSLEGLMLKLKLQYLATWCEELTHWKKPWCWESLKVGGKGDDGGWDGWMASLTRWKWVWVNSGSLWWLGNPGLLQSMRSQRVGHNWMTELNWKGTKESLNESERGKWKAGLKINIQKTKIMACGPITSWQIDGGKNGNSDRFYFLGLQNNCRWWLQPWNEKTLAPWKKSYGQARQHIKKQRHYFANKGPYSQTYGFPVVMYRCENWTIKKAKGLMFSNCGVGEDSWVSLGQQGDQTNLSNWNQPIYSLEVMMLSVSV